MKGVSSNDDGPKLSSDINQGNDDSGATSMDETNNTHLEVYTLRKSSRQTKLPSTLNDFIVEGKVEYGVERVVNYANLNHDNYCFISALLGTRKVSDTSIISLDSSYNNI
ncbi:hypothetical protein Tco_1213766 [Tanacetum coccineum]